MQIGARAGKYKLGARAGKKNWGPRQGPGAGKYKDPYRTPMRGFIEQYESRSQYQIIRWSIISKGAI